MSREPKKPARVTNGGNCTGGKNKVQMALELAAEKLGLEVKPGGELPEATLKEIARRIGKTSKTLGNWRRAGRVVTNDVGTAFELEKLSGIPAAYLTRK